MIFCICLLLLFYAVCSLGYDLKKYGCSSPGLCEEPAVLETLVMDTYSSKAAPFRQFDLSDDGLDFVYNAGYLGSLVKHVRFDDPSFRKVGARNFHVDAKTVPIGNMETTQVNGSVHDWVEICGKDYAFFDEMDRADVSVSFPGASETNRGHLLVAINLRTDERHVVYEPDLSGDEYDYILLKGRWAGAATLAGGRNGVEKLVFFGAKRFANGTHDHPYNHFQLMSVECAPPFKHEIIWTPGVGALSNSGYDQYKYAQRPSAFREGGGGDHALIVGNKLVWYGSSMCRKWADPSCIWVVNLTNGAAEEVTIPSTGAYAAVSSRLFQARQAADTDDASKPRVWFHMINKTLAFGYQTMALSYLDLTTNRFSDELLYITRAARFRDGTFIDQLLTGSPTVEIYPVDSRSQIQLVAHGYLYCKFQVWVNGAKLSPYDGWGFLGRINLQTGVSELLEFPLVCGLSPPVDASSLLTVYGKPTERMVYSRPGTMLGEGIVYNTVVMSAQYPACASTRNYEGLGWFQAISFFPLAPATNRPYDALSAAFDPRTCCQVSGQTCTSDCLASTQCQAEQPYVSLHCSCTGTPVPGCTFAPTQAPSPSPTTIPPTPAPTTAPSSAPTAAPSSVASPPTTTAPSSPGSDGAYTITGASTTAEPTAATDDAGPEAPIVGGSGLIDQLQSVFGASLWWWPAAALGLCCLLVCSLCLCVLLTRRRKRRRRPHLAPAALSPLAVGSSSGRSRSGSRSGRSRSGSRGTRSRSRSRAQSSTAGTVGSSMTTMTSALDSSPTVATSTMDTELRA